MLCQLLLLSYMTTLRQLTSDGNIIEYTDSVSKYIDDVVHQIHHLQK